jgi:outer membrane protein OmpA-like peptidoglycan-associated protein
MDKLFTPTAALSFGHYFTPVVGARLHVNAWQAKSGFKDLDQYYKWKYVTPDLDLMLNLSNMFGAKKTHALNVILLGGVGLNYAWDNNELRDMNVHATRVPLAWGVNDGDSKNILSHNLRAGLRFETNPAKPLGLSLELNANSTSDRFNSKTNDADDWQFTAMLGLSFRFNHKYQGPEYITKTVEVIDTVEVDEPEVIKVKKTRPVEKEKMDQTKVEKVIYYQISESDASKASGIDAAIKEAADLMKSSSDAKITVTGYADKGTGTAAINKRLAKQRADGVAKKLTKEHGLDSKSITVDSKGDTVQPFPADNDKNRCVIVTGEGTFPVKYTVQEEYEAEETVMKKVKKTQTRMVEVKEKVNY